MDADRRDVDARFLLANERTLLAWVRTALTLLAGGVAVQQLTDGSTPLALALLVTGGLSGVAGGVRFRAADAAIRAGRLPAQGRAPYVLVAGVVLLAVAAVVVALLRGP